MGSSTRRPDLPPRAFSIGSRAEPMSHPICAALLLLFPDFHTHSMFQSTLWSVPSPSPALVPGGLLDWSLGSTDSNLGTDTPFDASPRAPAVREVPWEATAPWTLEAVRRRGPISVTSVLHKKGRRKKRKEEYGPRGLKCNDEQQTATKSNSNGPMANPGRRRWEGEGTAGYSMGTWRLWWRCLLVRLWHPMMYRDTFPTARSVPTYLTQQRGVCVSEDEALDEA
ncbi:hypothetical protein BDP55DRAFT_74748 [Colletotrichum godetiae]|uniref:Uncharacterized protein n=1 Tax=Colletotrichum godetiae TaxID=1209918 RepID=A0AAJ0ASH8_9PEZI|nr:uncharacterized protein BDP55DRAFT_74748 [Colletotrichum godetiae]KAK1688010.1 hypothetical protein BDP55DRAFT_74748 [Colletotrichum godetiae]